MPSSKPPNVCWCDCHITIDDEGRRVAGAWPEYDAPVALLTACEHCQTIHRAFVYGGAGAAMTELHRLTALPPEPQPSKISLTLKEPPSSNRWHRNVNGRTILSKEARDYTAYVGDQCVLARVRKIAAPTPVAVLVEWHRSRKSGDLDKRLSIAIDALQGHCFTNDSQIVRIVAERRDSERRGFIDVTVLPTGAR